MKIKQALLKYIAASTSSDLKLKVAERAPSGALGEALEPNGELTVLFVLSHDRDLKVAAAAKKSFEEYPPDLLLSALDEKLDPLVVRKVVEMHRENDAILIFAAFNPGIDDETLKALAESGPEEIVALLAEETGLLREKPFLIDAVKKNPLTSTLMKKALDEIACPGAAASAPASVRQPATLKPEETFERLKVPRELVDDRNADEKNVLKMISNLTMAQKIKLALTGNKAARELLIKDSNKMIAVAVLKNPRITEEEVARVTTSKSTPEDVLRQVARNKDWVKNYNIKIGMVENPKTPLMVSIKMLDFLLEKDLAKIAKSKNIPSVLASTARRKLDSKMKK